jgi:hypothetical protein
MAGQDQREDEGRRESVELELALHSLRMELQPLPVEGEGREQVSERPSLLCDLRDAWDVCRVVGCADRVDPERDGSEEGGQEDEGGEVAHEAAAMQSGRLE